MDKITLTTPIRYLKRVGPVMSEKLKRLNLETAEDLIYYFPFRHEDYSLISPIAQIREGETVTAIGRIIKIENNYLRSSKQKTIQKAILKDNTGIIEIIWFNQTYLSRTFSEPKLVSVSGKVKRQGRKLQFISPNFEIIGPEEEIDSQKPEEKLTGTGRLVPIYPVTFGVSNNYLRRVISQALPNLIEEVEEFLPEKIIKEERLIGQKEAVNQIHFPENKAYLAKARKRLAFDELFLLQLNFLLNKRRWEKRQPAPKMKNKPGILKKLISSLPFELTNCQKRAIKEITEDLNRPVAMNRLLQGDVGSGKTIVAAAVILVAAKNGYQSVLMVPTEILAQQHYQNLKTLLTPLGISVKLITGSNKKEVKDSKEIWQLIVGTHALLHRRRDFRRIGLVIIDEQHRFGVSQRSILIEKSNLPDKDRFSPHILTMTATPIPRTITLTVYGDLDVSSLDQMPPGRKPVKTYLVPGKKRKDCYQWIKKQIKTGQSQAFIICPLVEDSETLESVKSATEEYRKLKKEVFSAEKIGLIHGRMKSKEKEAVLAKMKNGETEILVATPVVEVGIDIAGANIMIIEAANRFGLAQLHQLRGRVGRGKKQAYCFLFAGKTGLKAKKRLRAMEENKNGLKLAEIDLKIRGPGEIYGTQQHGFPEFKIASYTDLALIRSARFHASQVLEKSPTLALYPKIKQKLNRSPGKIVAPN